MTSGFEEYDSGVDKSYPSDISSNVTTVNAATTPMDVYYIMAEENTGRNTYRTVTFDNEIKGVWFDMDRLGSYSGVSKSGASYNTISEHGSGSQNAWSTEKLRANWSTSISGKPDHKNDWFGVDTDDNTLYVGFNNSAQHGDVIRVFVDAGNNAPVARNDDGVVNEDATLTVSDGANKSATGSYDANGEHSGDVIHTSNTSSYDSDADSDTLTVSAVRTGSTEGLSLIHI